MTNKNQKLEKEDRNWVPLEAYNYLVESRNKFNLDLNNDVIENLLSILNNFWKERLDREVNHFRTMYQNEIKELKRRLKGKEATNDVLLKTTSNYNNNMSNKFTKTGSTNPLGKKSNISGNNNYINNINTSLKDDYFFKTAMNVRDRQYENEIANLKKKLEEKEIKDKKKRNKIYNQGNLLMTQKICDEVANLKDKISSLYKEYENKVKYSVNNYENSEFKNKIMNEGVKTFFYEVLKEIDSIEKKIGNWKFNIQRNIGGYEYALKNN